MSWARVAMALTMAIVTLVFPARADEPSLPAGLGGDEDVVAPADVEAVTGATHANDYLSELPFDLSGFWELRLGSRVQHDSLEKQMSIAETRLQLEGEKEWDLVTLKVTSDFFYDPVLDKNSIDLERGWGWLDLREASLAFRPTDFMDVKAGRQVLTWGTGDLLFINDLFPKDWNSFFIGRDVEYLKAPSDAVKTSLFSNHVNLNVVYTPSFDADRYIDGRRISYWNDAMGARVGRSTPVTEDRPASWFTDDEIAARLYRNVGAYELAGYFYHGFWKSPGGVDPADGDATFPKLAVYGASARGPVGRGIGSFEVGYYDSTDDSRGGNPFVRTSELRAMISYEQEVATDFTASGQWYVEHMMDYEDYRRTLPAGAIKLDEDRHVLTLRLTKLLMSQNLKLSLFTFYSPTDNDTYVRPIVNYKVDDHWTVEAGGNVFAGENRQSFFGQFVMNSNAYVAARYSF